MDRVRGCLNTLKEDVTNLLSNDDALQALSLEDLDDALKLKYKLDDGKWTWKEREAETKDIKERFMNLLSNDSERFKALIYWKDSSDWSTKLDLNKFKQHIIEYVNTTNTEKSQSYSGIPCYDHVFELLRGGEITLMPQDIALVDVRFIEYLTNLRVYKNPTRITLQKTQTHKRDPVSDSDDDDYDVITKAHMGGMERFWINVLASGRKDIASNAVMVALGMDIDPRMRYLPIKVTALEGDLLPQIIQHYNAATLSPMIKYRRNLGILLDNQVYNYYDYQEMMANGDFLTSSIALEFPYMCYVYVDRVEVEVSDFDYKNKKRHSIYVSVGDEYLMKAYHSVKKKECDMICSSKTRTLTCTNEESDKPCYYVTIGFGICDYQTVSAIRVFGRAISLV